MATTYTEGGPGRKACSCGLFVAARTNRCPKCGHVFVNRTLVRHPAEPRKQTVEPDDGASAERGKELILVMSGACPVPCEGTSRAEIQEWAYLIAAEVPAVVLSRNAALQWLRQFFPFGSEAFLTAASHLPHCRSLYADDEFARWWGARMEKS